MILFYCGTAVIGMFTIVSLFTYFFLIPHQNKTQDEDRYVSEKNQTVGEKMETDIEIQKWIAFCVSVYNKNIVLEKEKVNYIQVSKLLTTEAIVHQEAMKLS
jgi:hypothetical protein